jgi:hypothetical protein
MFEAMGVATGIDRAALMDPGNARDAVTRKVQCSAVDNQPAVYT